MATEEAVTVKKYRSLDGNLYDKLEVAERHDARWRDENEWEMDKEIAGLCSLYNRLVKRITAYAAIPSSKPYFPVLVTMKEKHGEEYFLAMTEQGLLDVYWDIFQTRLGDYGLYNYLDGKWAEIVKHIVETEDKVAAYGMIVSRRDYQYENVEAEPYIKVYDD